jgi:hypothetical protein
MLSWCLQFQDEANHCCPETVAALKAAWAVSESIPVTCVNTSTGTRAEGTFKIIDGKKRIVFSGPTTYAAEGTIMEPVEFEKAGDRGSTRNWQLSITVAGEKSLRALAADLPTAWAAVCFDCAPCCVKQHVSVLVLPACVGLRAFLVQLRSPS